MTYVLLFINAVAIALMALYVYVNENESGIGNNSAKLDITAISAMIVVALMAMYVYENERKMWTISAKRDLTGTNPAFFATEKEHINLGSNTIVKFDTVKTNIDNGYDVITGVFTASRAGTYEFSANFISGNTNFLELNLMKNNDFIVRGHAAQAMSTAGSLRAIVELNDGDRIYIKHPRSSGVLHGDHYSMFSGHLI